MGYYDVLKVMEKEPNRWFTAKEIYTIRKCGKSNAARHLKLLNRENWVISKDITHPRRRNLKQRVYRYNRKIFKS